jgi:hypothetical protein
MPFKKPGRCLKSESCLDRSGTKGSSLMVSREFSLALLFAVMATPAIAQQQQDVGQPPQQTISTYCATIQPGNPYSPVYDYQSFNAFRGSGSYDNRGSAACARDPMYAPGGTSPFKVNPYPNPSWF